MIEVEDVTSVAIVKPVNALCNMACEYCYMQHIKQENTYNRMSEEILKATINFFCSELDEIEFIWHGGEPLLAGIDFYRQVVEQQKRWLRVGRKIANFVQTNATLINEKWAKFFAENDFLVGVSIDAPPEAHNLKRPFKNGGSSLGATMKGIELARNAGVFNGIICCIGDHNWNRPKEIFDFFVSRNIKNLKFLRVKEPFPGAVNKERYFDFMASMFKRWLEIDDPEIEIRDIKSIISIALGGKFKECVYMGRCDKFVTIYNDGSIFACDNFPKSAEFCFGNVTEGRTAIKHNKNLKHFRDMASEYREKCSRCEWFHICNGWCLHQHFCTELEGNSCDGLKRLFREIFEMLKRYGMI